MRHTRVPFFVVSGADGVGKTTAARLTGQILEARGFSVMNFHHIAKSASNNTVSATPRSHGKPQKSRLRHWIPTPVKMIISSLQDERKYIARLQNILYESASKSCIALSDRYVYDRVITLRLRKRPLVQQLAVRTACFLLRKPTLTILITESPEIIRQRKQELSEEEIHLYQLRFIKFCTHIRAPMVVLPVNSQTPERVAQILADIIISKLQ